MTVLLWAKKKILLNIEKQAMEDTQAGQTYENKVFYNVDGSATEYQAKAGTTFRNCIFYNSGIAINNRDSGNVTITFDGCSFIGAYGQSAPLSIKSDDAMESGTLDVVVKNCTFTQTARGINIPKQGSTSAKTTVEIVGCTFNGITAEKYAALQIADVAAIKFTNNTINSLGTAKTVINFNTVLFTDSFDSAAMLAKLTFSGNTVSKSIPESGYVDADGANQTTFCNSALELFKKGLK